MSSLADRLCTRKGVELWRVAKVRREALARAAANGRRPDPGFKEREQAYAELHPHLLEHKHCGLCPDSADVPRRRVKLPNGLVLHTSWYKVPTTEADATRALREQIWLIAQASA